MAVRRNDEGEAQRRRWTFYEAIKSWVTYRGDRGGEGSPRLGGSRFFVASGFDHFFYGFHQGLHLFHC